MWAFARQREPGGQSLDRVVQVENWQRDGGRAGSSYWLTVALEVCSSADRACACVLAIADFMINAARAGMQTHMDLMDLFRPPTCRGWEPMATRMNKETVKRAKRLMG
jgi:hypothetical protein